MSDPHFFGYGSLVNRRTHGYGPTHPATLSGWRREWRATLLRPAAFLTARPVPGGAVDGLIAPVPGGDWAALDLRETGYDRVPATGVAHGLDHAPPIAVYSIPPADDGPAGARPILLSYLDVVVQGFLQVFGEAGADRFFASTDNWALPVADDRKAPLYPRAQSLAPAERRFVDSRLDDLGCARVDVARTGLGHDAAP
ncbi:gamma-glutamylcyclotransferase [Palleronia sediminis]|uniref:Gamma-glutamylcyclotransferase n=1 Tax=Palleronia sediminis TaxID=2547833 RepID=A0A4R5ZXD0_9RHOB|nr:gamma-glutamylcyclotransferase family protein [Palleronia sediminis]TDL74925.1 gamma-glutamylcyclotransferase [Palleronia sediminis]